MYDLSIQRTDGIELLEELFKHFSVINEDNIGKDYRNKFGDPEDYFGKSDSFLDGDDFVVDLLPVYSKNNGVSISFEDANVVFNITVAVHKEHTHIFDSLLFDPAVMHYRLDLHSMKANDTEFEYMYEDYTGGDSILAVQCVN